jgi:putative hemolysin
MTIQATAGASAQAQVQAASYTMRLAQSQVDIRAVQRLRFEVFNLELLEGLVASYASGLDADPFDEVCDHLMVEDAISGRVVGTYRLQTGAHAASALGYYCAQEFDFSIYEALRPEMLELGRACIAHQHRSMQVLSLLWRGIAEYAMAREARYLFGCSSLTSQDPAVGHAACVSLQAYLAPQRLRTSAHAAYALPRAETLLAEVHIPKLLTAYLALGAWICSPPALDRNFGTIDFLTCLDLQSPHMAQRRKRFGITL